MGYQLMRDIRDSGLPANVTMVGWAIGLRSKGSVWYGTIRRIAGDTRLGERTVRRAIKRLQDAGWVTVERTNGDTRGATYRLHDPGHTGQGTPVTQAGDHRSERPRSTPTPGQSGKGPRSERQGSPVTQAGVHIEDHARTPNTPPIEPQGRVAPPRERPPARTRLPDPKAEAMCRAIEGHPDLLGLDAPRLAEKLLGRWTKHTLPVALQAIKDAGDDLTGDENAGERWRRVRTFFDNAPRLAARKRERRGNGPGKPRMAPGTFQQAQPTEMPAHWRPKAS